jgi:PEP-CTERM motif
MRIHSIISAIGAAGLAMGLASAPAVAFPINPQTCGSKSADPALSCTGAPGSDVNDSLADVQAAYPGVEIFFDKDEDGDSDSPPDPFTDADFFLTDLNFGDVEYSTTTDGYFLLSSALLSAYDTFILVLKGGNLVPRWSMFEIDVANLVAGVGEFDGYFYGLWSSSRQGLSHASLYTGGDGGNQVPEPGTLALLGLGLLGLGMARRSKPD